MKFLFWNLYECFESIAQRIESEGSDTFSYYDPSNLSKSKKIPGKDIINLIDDPFDVIRKEDKKQLIICIDDNSLGDMCDYLTKEGWKVIGSSHLSDMAEHDRDFGNMLFEKIGIPIPETKVFNNIDKATDFVKKSKWDGFVFKASGRDFAGSSYSYVAKDKDEITFYMNHIKEEVNSGKINLDDFEVQEKKTGMEVSVSAWFNGDHFIDDYLFFTFENKKIGYGDKGEATGCIGQVMRVAKAKGNPYFENYLKKLEPLLREARYNGEWDFNNIYVPEEDKFYALEHTPRFGWYSTEGEFSLLVDNGKKISDWLTAVATKGEMKDAFPYNKLSFGRALHIKDPARDTEDIYGTPLDFKEYEDNFWFKSVGIDIDGNYIATNNSFAVLETVGETYEEARIENDEILDEVIIPDLFYREDIAERYLKAEVELKKYMQ